MGKTSSLLGLLGIAAALLAQPASEPQVTKIVGFDPMLALLSDGSVRGWGASDKGQLGPVTSVPSAKGRSKGPVAIALPGKAIDVAIGGDDLSYALLADGTVVQWGGGKSGVPERVPGLTNITQMAAAGAVIALSKDGSVYAWGSRNSGMIGDGKHPQRYGEGAPPALAPVKVPNVSNIVQIAVGDGHVLALTAEGHVVTWGSNYSGALGRPPRRELPMDSAAEVPGLTDVAAVIGGAGISTVLKKDGTVWVWGGNQMGQFGNGQREDPPGMTNGWELVPQKVAGIANVTAVTQGIAGRHTLVLLKDGTLRGWGNTDWGQIGAGVGGTFQERPVTPKISGVKAVFAVGNNSFAVKTDGSLWAWGSGGAGEWPFTANTKLPVRIELK